MKVFIVLATLTGLALADKPLGGYGAPLLGEYGAPPLSSYGSAPLGTYESAGEAGNNNGDDSPISGIPGTDYPIYNEVPETSFSCEGKVEGGYYADPEAECQAFHICAADGEGGLLKMSSLCHNGTIFNQEIFTCDLWSNFNCADAESLYSKNEELAAAREEASAALAASASAGGVSAAAASAAASGIYGVPVAPPLPPVVAHISSDYGVNNGIAYESPVAPRAAAPAASGYGAPIAAVESGYGAPIAAVESGYGSPFAPRAAAPEPIPAASGYGAPITADSSYGAPLSSYIV